MSSIVVDTALLAQIQGAYQPVELRDPSGRLLGHFVPIFSQPRSAQMEPKISEDELNRRQQARGGRSLAEIMADLEKRS
jgi:hypothetical protein